MESTANYSNNSTSERYVTPPGNVWVYGATIEPITYDNFFHNLSEGGSVRDYSYSILGICNNYYSNGAAISSVRVVYGVILKLEIKLVRNVDAIINKCSGNRF